MQIKKVGVIGAGQMGTDIAQVCAQAGALSTASDSSMLLLSFTFVSVLVLTVRLGSSRTPTVR